MNVDGVKYKGSRVSRKNLYDSGDEDEDEEQSDDSDEGDVDLSDDSNESANGIEMDSEDEAEFGGQHSQGSESESEVGSESESESESEEAKEARAEAENRDRSKLQALMDKEQKLLLSRLSSTARADAEKGSAVQQQMNIYEGMLDARISLQKAVSTANVLPVSASVAQDMSTDETGTLKSEAVESLLRLGNAISSLRFRLMESDNASAGIKLAKKRSFENAFADMEALDKALEAHREAVLTKWSRKVNASSGATALQASKFKSLNQTAAVQVKSMLTDMDRLVKRTRINRSNVSVLGEEPAETNQKSHLAENDNIFDDSDFYRLLLKDLVDKRMADSNSTAGLKWTSVKTKVKKNVDTKASKGRKLRYHVQEKIQGFDVPRPVFSWTDDQTDDLFMSLLGQKIQLDESVPSDDEHSEPENDGLAIFG